MHKMYGMSNYKTIRIYDMTFEKLNDLQKEFGGSKTEILEGSMDYFLKTRINPRETPKDFNKEFIKLKNTFISFIKTQDKNIDSNSKKIDALVSKFKETLDEKSSKELSQETMKLMLQNFGKALVEKIKN